METKNCGLNNKEQYEELQDEESEAYKFLFKFCMKYHKDEQERNEFFQNLNELIDEEIEKEKECGL